MCEDLKTNIKLLKCCLNSALQCFICIGDLKIKTRESESRRVRVVVSLRL